MLEFLQNYSAEIISTSTILVAVAYPFAKRMISDSNMLKTFMQAKESIIESNNIKVDIVGSLTNINGLVKNIQEQALAQAEEFERVILEFQDSEMYQKMLLSAEQVEAIHQTLQNKDQTIQLLGATIKSLEKQIAEINNKIEV